MPVAMDILWRIVFINFCLRRSRKLLAFLQSLQHMPWLQGKATKQEVERDDTFALISSYIFLWSQLMIPAAQVAIRSLLSIYVLLSVEIRHPPLKINHSMTLSQNTSGAILNGSMLRTLQSIVKTNMWLAQTLVHGVGNCYHPSQQEVSSGVSRVGLYTWQTDPCLQTLLCFNGTHTA